MRTMSNLLAINPGFDPENVLTLSIAGSTAVHGSPSAVRAGFTATMDQLRAIPGVKAVSLLFGGMPLNGDSELPFWVEGRPKPAETSQMDMALFYAVDADYLNIMRIPLLRGRFLTAQDGDGSRRLQAGALTDLGGNVAIDDDIAFFERVPTLSVLGKQALRVLAIGAETRQLQSGAVLFYAGELADGGYIVQEGSLTLEPATPSGGKDYSVGPGTLLGELALLTDVVSPGHRDCARTDSADPHSAQPVPQDAGRLSGRRAAHARYHGRAGRQLDARTLDREGRARSPNAKTPSARARSSR